MRPPCGDLLRFRSSHRALSRGERGATALETAIILPLLLLVILILLWVGVMSNARASLTTALASAARLATTRGESALVGREMVPELNQYARGQVQDLAIAELLSQDPPDPNDPFAYYHTFARATFGRVGVNNLSDLPPAYIYALFYLSQSLKLSLGPGVRFPCDPGTDEGYNCVGCYFLNPNDPECRVDGVPCPLGSGDPIPPGALGIECRFRPGSPLLRPIDAMFHVLFGGGYEGKIVMRSKFFPRVE